MANLFIELFYRDITVPKLYLLRSSKFIARCFKYQHVDYLW